MNSKPVGTALTSHQLSLSPPPSAGYQSAYRTQNNSSYNQYSASTCPSSRSSPDSSSAFANQNSLHPTTNSYVSNDTLPCSRGASPPDQQDADEHIPPTKRLRTTTFFSQIDSRNSDKPSHLVLTPSHFAISAQDVYRGVSGAEDTKALPPIMTREEQAQGTGHADNRLPLIRPGFNSERHHNLHSTPGSDDAHENSLSSHKPTDQNSNPTQPQSYKPRISPSFFSVEPVYLSAQLDRQFSQSPSVPTNPVSAKQSASSEHPSFVQLEHQHGSAASHPASPLVLSSHHPQPLLSAHPAGYMPSLPSPVGTTNAHHSQHALHHRASYPGSPSMTITPSSATFSPNTTTAFGRISPPTVHEPSSPAYCTSASAFPHHAAAHLMGSPYPASGTATLGNQTGVSSGNRSVSQPSLTAADASKSDGGRWATSDGQAPRRRGKLPQAVTALLRNWLMSHTSHPYPTEEEKKFLCEQTALNMNQVSNWFINARRRILVPPTGCNSTHQVRQPIRRQAQTQLARAAADAAVGMAHSLPSPSPTFPSGAFDFRGPHFANPRSPHGAISRSPTSPVTGQYATYPSSYQMSSSSAPATPQYGSSPYPSYQAYYHPTPAYAHLNASSRLPSPRSQPNTPGYPPPQIVCHAPESQEAYSRPVAVHPPEHPDTRPGSTDMPSSLKLPWQHTQSHIEDTSANACEGGN
ncbi:uncharacterized protein MELLADRAFT_86714 [Melampsora larici-populina 98AG31]|uniref:Homeobox domain-containing protein n=1 Tax=Melampsora larici-populina (strain 98AG31 / pathotype 3-4-7) TaxID=747676 RepID=F4R343_MELLP|nr:uncharacterized protein MELLADRAFT_86714 [Melampsora larici-populina 98AG31]EGG12562.1 hypothetical protein MELLADRAFT_86714 [Melampsora larici-populina 98AG31]